MVLKAPTVMYVFILITLRALRFETRWVLLAGGVAMIGWTALVAAALLQGSAGVTRSFLAYVTSPEILIGAEFDKLVSVAMVTALLALVVARGRALLVEATREGVAAAELSRFFVPEIADRIRAKRSEAKPQGDAGAAGDDETADRDALVTKATGLGIEDAENLTDDELNAAIESLGE